MSSISATTPNPCFCCGGGPPTGCNCALEIPVFSSPYASYADATTAVSNLVTDCVMYAATADGSSFQLTTATIAITTTIDIHLADNSINRGNGYISVAMGASETVSVALSVTTNGTIPARPSFVSSDFSSCDGTLIDSGLTAGDENSASDTYVFTAPSSGEYYILVGGGGAGDATLFDLTVTLTFSSGFTVNPVIALWDDSGTTRKLWACPKLLLPPLTEDTGTWYADCTAASDVLVSDKVSGCIGYYDGSTAGTDTFSFTASGSSSLTLSESSSGTAPFTNWVPLNAWGGFNGVSGDTISISYSASGTGGTGQAATSWLYDDAASLIQTVTSTSGSLSFSTLPYTGRYTIRVQASFESLLLGGSITASATISSSGTMSVNQIQALYDVGLGCAARLDCGDSC